MVNESNKDWVIILNQLTYVGKKKKELSKSLDEKFGKGEWKEAHLVDGKVIDKNEVYSLYEDAYYEFLKSNPLILGWLIMTAKEVYDIQPSNVNSECDYSIQECDATHLQDISIRRVLKRLGRAFEGNHLVQIRGHTSEGYILNPGKIPFHKPYLILGTEQRGWWDEGSVEDFYQKSKALLVNPEKLEVRLAIYSSLDVFFSMDKNLYYHAILSKEGELPNLLTHTKGNESRQVYSKKGNTNYVEITSSPLFNYKEWMGIIPKIILKNTQKKRLTFGELAYGK